MEVPHSPLVYSPLIIISRCNNSSFIEFSIQLTKSGRLPLQCEIVDQIFLIFPAIPTFSLYWDNEMFLTEPRGAETNLLTLSCPPVPWHHHRPARQPRDSAGRDDLPAGEQHHVDELRDEVWPCRLGLLVSLSSGHLQRLDENHGRCCWLPKCKKWIFCTNRVISYLQSSFKFSWLN